MTPTPPAGTNSPISGIAPSSAGDKFLQVAEIEFKYGSKPVLKDVSFSASLGEFLALLGPSGCGKTTLLQLIAGHLEPTSGEIWLRGQNVTRQPARVRNIGMVHQDGMLFPHLTARQNIAFGLEVRRVPVDHVHSRVDRLLQLVGISREEADRYPDQLSGGQQQRVAIARALAFAPSLVLMDEPLTHLDRLLREDLRNDLRRIHNESGTTTLLVTHDPLEALAVADRIGVLAAGRLLQMGACREVYDRPKMAFVARALGDANILPPGASPLSDRTRPVLIRPDRIQHDAPGANLSYRFQAQVVSTTYLGSDLLIEVQHHGICLRVRWPARLSCTVGEILELGVAESDRWPIPEDDPQ